MSYVKVDCDIINSSVWEDADHFRLYMLALVLARPRVFLEPVPQIEIGGNNPTGYVVPAGEYGFAGIAVANLASRTKLDATIAAEALRKMGEPEIDSRSQAYDGRRLVKVAGGFIVLNYIRDRNKDHTNAARQRRFRERQKNAGQQSRLVDKVSTRLKAVSKA